MLMPLSYSVRTNLYKPQRLNIKYTEIVASQGAIINNPLYLGYTGGRIFLAIVAKFFINMAFSGIYIWSTELFPTFVR